MQFPVLLGSVCVLTTLNYFSVSECFLYTEEERNDALLDKIRAGQIFPTVITWNNSTTASCAKAELPFTTVTDYFSKTAHPVVYYSSQNGITIPTITKLEIRFWKSLYTVSPLTLTSPSIKVLTSYKKLLPWKP